MGAADNGTYAFYTGSGNEEKVLYGFRKYVLRPPEEAFYPIIERTKRIHGIDRIVEKNLYPGYILIQTSDPMDLYFRGKDSRDQTVFRNFWMLRNEETLLRLEQDEDKMLSDLCGPDHRCDMSRGMIEGDRVIITSGPLKTFNGTIKKINRHKKTAQITMRFLRRDVNVLVGLEIIKKV